MDTPFEAMAASLTKSTMPGSVGQMHDGEECTLVRLSGRFISRNLLYRCFCLPQGSLRSTSSWGDGYPDRSTMLVGPPGIGKEALGYWFTHSGLAQGDFCLYVTRLSVKEVLQDEKGFGIDTQQKVPLWLASEGGQIKYDVNDLAGLSYNIKEVLKQNSGRRVRVVDRRHSPRFSCSILRRRSTGS